MMPIKDVEIDEVSSTSIIIKYPETSYTKYIYKEPITVEA